MNSVVQEWLGNDNISWKQQTVVLSCLRGCDGQTKEDLSKKLVRRIRSVVLYNAGNVDTPFMIEDMNLNEVKMIGANCDKYPIHFYMHALFACEIIGFKHPDEKIRKWFNEAYYILVHALHLKPETEEECDFRLQDGVNTPYIKVVEDEN
jgi:hypothetical protein